MKKLKLRSVNIKKLEERKYNKLLNGWKVISSVKKKFLIWTVKLEKD